jgi:hypothetical protein
VDTKISAILVEENDILANQRKILSKVNELEAQHLARTNQTSN